MTQQPFLALITPIGEGASQPPVGGGQPGYPTHPWMPPYGPAHPIAPGGSGGAPSHPIYYPPVIWDPSRPSNPIVNPGDPNNPAAGQGEGDRQPKIEWKSAWSPSTGWIVVGVPTGEHVTPSSEQNDQ